MKRILFANRLVPGITTLDQSKMHYLHVVMRMNQGDRFVAVDSQGYSFDAQLGSKDSNTCEILSPRAKMQGEPEKKITLYIPLLKADKVELVIQKSVELGVGDIKLYIAKRSIVKPSNLEKKINRWQKIAEEATKQCRRSIVPKVTGMYSLTHVAKDSVKGVFAWEEETGAGFREFMDQNQDHESLAILTGPEGGLAEDEAKTLIQAGWTSVSLGSRILRAETAAIAMLTCTMYGFGEMG